jgi:hypothetical protein
MAISSGVGSLPKKSFSTMTDRMPDDPESGSRVGSEVEPTFDRGAIAIDKVLAKKLHILIPSIIAVFPSLVAMGFLWR